jgi:hypothetical protein
MDQPAVGFVDGMSLSHTAADEQQRITTARTATGAGARGQ